MVRGRTVADDPHARLPDRGRAVGIALGVRLGGERDHVGELADRLEVAQLGQPREPERVQAIAREQRQIGVVGPDDAAGRVVQEIALADRLDEQRVGRLVAGGAAPAAATSPVAPSRRRGRRRLGEQSAAARAISSASRSSVLAHAISAKAAAAASTVRVEVLARVGERREPRLELRRRRVDAAGEQRPAPRAVGLGVARGGAGVVGRRLGREEDGQQPGRVDHRHRRGRRPPRAGRRRARRSSPTASGTPPRRAARARRARRPPRAGSRSACRPGRRRRPARSAPSARASRRTRPRAARRRGSCPSP